MIKKKEIIMNTGKRWSIRQIVSKTVWMLFTSAILLLSTQQVLASTAANTTITNTVTITYDDATGTNSYTDSAVATITVLLRAAAPTITSPADVDPTTEVTLNTLTYTLTSNANGSDDYTISTAVANVDLSGEVIAIVGGPVFTLGGTTLAADAPIGANSITVPYDSNADGNSAATNGIVAGSTIVVGGNPYVVNSVTENAGANTTTIEIAGTIAGTAGNIGEVVGEQIQFQINLTTGTLTAGITNGTHTLIATATSSADNTRFMDQVDPTVLTVRSPRLSIAKYVQVVNGPAVVGGGSTYGPIDTGSGAGSRTYYQTINALPAAELEYIIVVENTDVNGGDAVNVVLEDPIPQFTSYVAGSMRLNPDGGGFVGLNDGQADTDGGEYDNTAGAERIWIYAGTGGSDVGAGTFGDGTGGDLDAGDTTIGVFRVTVD
jgi:hypothetical protein